jgi:hypothetical protein
MGKWIIGDVNLALAGPIGRHKIRGRESEAIARLSLMERLLPSPACIGNMPDINP